MNSTEPYDRIGASYRQARKEDPRLARLIIDALGDAETVVNVGAGTGSYEPKDRFLVAVEPSITMLQQRPRDAAPVVREFAEHLPFRGRWAQSANCDATSSRTNETSISTIPRV